MDQWDKKPKPSAMSGMKDKLQANKANVLLWGSFITLVVFVYHFLSDGDFSFLLVRQCAGAQTGSCRPCSDESLAPSRQPAHLAPTSPPSLPLPDARWLGAVLRPRVADPEDHRAEELRRHLH